MGIVSFCLVLIGLFWNPFGLFALLGLVFGVVELWNQYNKGKEDKVMKGLSIAGITFSAIEIIWFIIVMMSI